MLLVAVCLAPSSAWGESPSTVAAMVKATEAFLDALDATQRDQATFSFEADERLNWHFIPRERKGVSLKSLNPGQRRAAMALLRTGLSKVGYRKVTLIRDLESVLARLEGSERRFPRDPDLYFFSVFGTPSTSGTWGWRYEGHHCSLNFTIVKGEMVVSEPLFVGANPARVLDGALSGLRTLAVEEDEARALLKSLNDEQKKQAILSDEAPADILTKADRTVKMLEDKGIAYSDLNEGQRNRVRRLVEEYARTVPSPLADARLAEIDAAGWDAIKFAWMGGPDPGQGHYYRIQGKTFLIELDNTQNNANHVHAVWRDFKGDFGRDVLAMHYRLYPHAIARVDANLELTRPVVVGNAALQARLERLSAAARR
jgi:hypothetical protein